MHKKIQEFLLKQIIDLIKIHHFNQNDKIIIKRLFKKIKKKQD